MDIIPQDTPQKQCKDCETSIPATNNRWYCDPCEIERKKERKQRRKERIEERRLQHLGEPKLCEACKQTFPATSAYFHRAALSKDGWDTLCKRCKGEGRTFGIELPECKEGEKCCVGCLKVFPATAAYFHKLRAGLYPQCKKCRGNSTYFGKERIECGDDEKWCPSCERVLPRTKEYFSWYKGEGFKGACKECQSKTYERDKDVINQRQRAKRKANPEKFREYERLRYARNPQAINERNKLSYRRHWHKHKHSKNLYRLAHLEKHNAYMRNREARKKAIPGTLTDQQIQYKLRKQKFRCYYAACGHTKFEKRKGRYIYHIEHTIPVSRREHGPRNDASYVVLACPHCNLTKGNKLPHEWVEGGTLF